MKNFKGNLPTSACIIMMINLITNIIVIYFIMSNYINL
jgi:hypothetical protein